MVILSIVEEEVTMKYSGRSLTLIALACIIVAGPVFSQGLLPKKVWDLTIAVNVPNAIIQVDNVAIAGATTKVAGGSHNVKVHADGYADFNGSVSVSSSMTFTVRLNPILYPLTIRVATAGAKVFVDNADYTGKVAPVMSGTHIVLVTAPGYQDYNASVAVSGPLTLDVVLQPAGVLLTVNANVPDATVTVNNLVKGKAPYSDYYVPGTYSLQVSADGYADYVANINFDKATTLNVQLKALAPAMLSFVIPAAFRDNDVRQGDPQGQVKIWVDNRLINPKQETERIAVSPGRHKIRVASGAFSMQVPDFIAQSGISYTIDFTITVNVKTASNSQ
jgi:hypothetical protein